MNLTLEQTCGACPEQYDVYLDGEVVGYMRLRHGYFRAECHGEIVYEAHPNGDGRFEDDERETHLNAALKAIEERLAGKAEATSEEVASALSRAAFVLWRISQGDHHALEKAGEVAEAAVEALKGAGRNEAWMWDME